MVVKITLKPKKGNGHLAKKISSEVDIEDNAVVLSLTELIAKETKLNTNRIRLTVKGEKPVGGTLGKDRVLNASDSLSALAEDGALTVYYRDLGPQVPWRTVFLIEYAGPLIINPLFYFCRKQIYGTSEAPTRIQEIVFACVVLHFVKRELETAFVHKFSLATMPLFNLFKNCSHYWLLSGVLLAYFGYAPQSWWTSNPGKLSSLLFYSGGALQSPTLLIVLPIVWAFAEASNFVIHLNLSKLRPAGSTERRIPYGYGFNRLSCPNYFFEAWSWLQLTVLSGNWAMALFFVVGTTQMYFWAVKKHRRYLKEFPDYPKNRKAMFPYIA